MIRTKIISHSQRFVILYYLLTKALMEKGKSPFHIYPIKELRPLNNDGPYSASI